MRKITIVIVATLIFCSASVVMASATFVEFKDMMQSDVKCSVKRNFSQHIDNEKDVLQDLLQHLGGIEALDNAILAKAKRVNALMNEVFAYEGKHPWSKDDMRVLRLIRSMWEHSIDPRCFNRKTDGFSKEEWLRGAAWAMQQKCQ